MTSDSSRHRLGLLAVAALSLFGALFARLWFLQVVEAEEFTLQAEGNATQTVVTPAARGKILDRNGVVLVDNRPSIVVTIDRQAFDDLDEEEQDDLLQRLSITLSTGRQVADQRSVPDLRKRLADERFSRLRPVPIAEDISPEEEIYFAEQADRYPSVVVERRTVRSYPYGSLAAHVLGYTGALSDEQWAAFQEENDPDKPYIQTDSIGKAGVEATYEQHLRGTPGQQVFEVDRRGRIIREIEERRVEPEAGDDVWLALDARVQYRTESALQARLLDVFEGPEGDEAGAMVVLDHDTGQVRAMASYPTYEPGDLVGGISNDLWADLQGKVLDERGEPLLDDEGREVTRPSKLLNRATQGAYPPASTFKLASSYAALKLQVRSPDQWIDDPGFYRLCDGDGPGCLKTNAGSERHGQVNLQKALTVSSDVYYYMIGETTWEGRGRLGEDALQRHIAELGFGSRTGIDLPAESPGQLPTPESEAALAESLFEADPGYYDDDPAVAADAGRWRTGYSADLTIGQKVNATPLQTANAYASLANGGRLIEPTVLDKITAAGDETEVVATARSVEDRLIREIDWMGTEQVFREGFRGVVDPTGQADRGTAVSQFEGFPFGSMPLAGKTGTAQTGLDRFGREKPDHSLFAAFTLGGPSAWTTSGILEFSGSGARGAGAIARLVLEPIADGSIDRFTIPQGGELATEQLSQESAEISVAGTD